MSKRKSFSQLQGRKQKLSSEPVRLRGRAGVKRRKRILARDNYTCKLCKAVLPITDLIVDHIIPLCKNGPDTDTNLQTLCKQCSDVKTLQEMGSEDGHVIRYDVRKRRGSNIMHSDPAMVGNDRETQGSRQNRCTNQNNSGDVREDSDDIY